MLFGFLPRVVNLNSPFAGRFVAGEILDWGRRSPSIWIWHTRALSCFATAPGDSAGVTSAALINGALFGFVAYASLRSDQSGDPALTGR